MADSMTRAVDINGRGVRVKGRGVGVGVGSAIPDSVIDNFENADAVPAGPYDSGEDITTYYSGDTAEYARSTTAVAEGSQSLELDTSNGGVVILSTDSDGLPRYPAEGETVRYLQRAGGSKIGLILAAGGSAGSIDGYYHFIDSETNEIRIARMDDGSFTEIATTSQSFSSGTWYWCECRNPSSSDSTILMEVYNVDTSTSPPSRGSLINSASTTDSNYLSSNIGFRAGSSGTSYADYLSIVE